MVIPFYPLPALLCIGIISQGQTLSNLRSAQQGNEVVVNYQLDGDQGKAYTVSLYSSYNDFATPLRMVQGDVAAKRVLPGPGKTIRWRVLDELNNFDGDISFEIRAVPAVPLFTQVMASAAKVKRGKEITITWAGGLAKEQVGVELLQGTQTIHAGKIDNNGRLIFSVPKNMKTGSYKIQLSQAGELTPGSSFAVQPKIPMLLKVVPVVLVGVAVIISGGGGSKNNSPTQTTDSFPEPPTLTN